MDLLWRVESIYSNKSIDNVYQNATIIKPEDLISKKYTATKSRYPLGFRKEIYEGYSLDFKTYLRLFRRIKVDPTMIDVNLDLKNYNDVRIFKSLIYYSTPYNLNILTPYSMGDLTYDKVLTPLGLLAIRLRKSYENDDFRELVEDTFLASLFNQISINTFVLKREFASEYNIDYKDLLLTADTYQYYPNNVKEILFLSNPFIFMWRD